MGFEEKNAPGSWDLNFWRNDWSWWQPELLGGAGVGRRASGPHAPTGSWEGGGRILNVEHGAQNDEGESGGGCDDRGGGVLGRGRWGAARGLGASVAFEGWRGHKALDHGQDAHGTGALVEWMGESIRLR
ncbi:MAG: hypothetical protein AAGD22_11065 [Verrucomicrobiota bacterium]